jgi:hypothetical protein
MPEDPDDAFGFGSFASVKDRIKQIRPSISTAPPPDLARIDAVADNAGFVSREANAEPEYPLRNQRYQKPEPRIPLNMRVPVSLGAAFQRFCEQERYSYPEGLAEVMRRAGLPLK